MWNKLAYIFVDDAFAVSNENRIKREIKIETDYDF